MTSDANSAALQARKSTVTEASVPNPPEVIHAAKWRNGLTVKLFTGW